MTAIIIEDELPAYRRLAKIIGEAVPHISILAHLDSIAAAEEWFGANDSPALVFCDIELADGTAFELLKKIDVNCPVIFTTAYDQYALEAFKTNGVEYLLKPIKADELKNALQKLETLGLAKSSETTVNPDTANAVPNPAKAFKTRFIVRFGEHIKSLMTEEIAYCYSESKATFARTFDGRTFPMDQNLDALEDSLDPQFFFRLNRQYLIHIKSIQEMRTYTKARVIVTLNPTVKELPVVSSERAAEFKQWLAGEL